MPDDSPHHSFRVFNPEGQIEKLIYTLSIGDGFIRLPYALIISDALLIVSFIFLIDDDSTQLVDDDGTLLIEDVS
jgi:hypothetical protein